MTSITKPDSRFNRNSILAIVYLLLIALFQGIFVVAASLVTIQSNTKFSFIWLSYIVIAGLPIAERISLTVIFLFVRQLVLPPCLSVLHTSPKVALLYCTCDDVVQECLTALGNQTYKNIEEFVLDDSQTDYYKKIVDLSSYNVVRRSNREGFKAGNINNWLSTQNENFDYFVIVDADSILPPDFVDKMLLYAEHPQNRQISCFESRIHAWKPRNRLQKALAVQLEMLSEEIIRVHNVLGIVLSNGHNNLCRTSSILSAGGFDERFISEDHATSLNLLSLGFYSQVVDVVSYEIPPISLDALKHRTQRWVRNDLQLLRHPWKAVSLVLQLQLTIRALRHFLWLPVALLGVIVLWLHDSSFTDFLYLGRYILFQGGYHHPQIKPILVMLVLYFLYLFITPIPQAIAARIQLRHYLYSTLVTVCLGFGMMPSVLKGVINALLRTRFPFDVTPKYEHRETAMTFVRNNRFLCCYCTVLTAGVIHNPAVLLFNWMWILPLIASPFVLYLAQENKENGLN